MRTPDRLQKACTSERLITDCRYTAFIVTHYNKVAYFIWTLLSICDIPVFTATEPINLMWTYIRPTVPNTGLVNAGLEVWQHATGEHEFAISGIVSDVWTVSQDQSPNLLFIFAGQIKSSAWQMFTEREKSIREGQGCTQKSLSYSKLWKKLKVCVLNILHTFML